MLVQSHFIWYFISIERFSNNNKQKIKNIILSLLFPATIHTIYNVFFSLTMINLRTKSFALIVILMFLTSIYSIGYLFFKKTKEVNYYFENNVQYPNKYKTLLTKDEFNKKHILENSKDASLEEIVFNEDEFKPFKNE